ncbi:MAG: hypothetical protein ACP5E4_02395 [Candidatus Aenigmatarchaeota archaeon]
MNLLDPSTVQDIVNGTGNETVAKVLEYFSQINDTVGGNATDLSAKVTEKAAQVNASINESLSNITAYVTENATNLITQKVSLYAPDAMGKAAEGVSGHASSGDELTRYLALAAGLVIASVAACTHRDKIMGLYNDRKLNKESERLEETYRSSLIEAAEYAEKYARKLEAALPENYRRGLMAAGVKEEDIYAGS